MFAKDFVNDTDAKNELISFVFGRKERRSFYNVWVEATVDGNGEVEEELRITRRGWPSLKDEEK